tara:strand:- start:412 stop:606 length:195 start_codon:yes stop_codon:yes gene_type:complete
MKLNLGNVATTEVDGFKSIEVGEDGEIIAVFYINSFSNGGTVSFVVHDGTKPLGPITVEYAGEA